MTLRPARRVEGIRTTLIRRMFDAAPPDAINLGVGQPDLPTPPGIALGGIAGIVRRRTGYTATAGDLELREAVARRYRGMGADAENVVITVGSQEAMVAGAFTLLDPGAEVLYPDPGYPAYPTVARLVGADPVPYHLHPRSGFRMRAADVVDRLSDRTGLVILDRTFESDRSLPFERELRELLEVLRDREIPWMSDEIYSGIRYEGEGLSPADLSPDGGLVISGLSKDASMAGWRIGWVVGPTAIVPRIVAVHQHLVTCASSVSQQAALAAFSPGGEVERALYLERYRTRRALMARELARIPRIGFREPEGAFYFFIDVSAFGDSLELARRILGRQKVISIPGTAFGEMGRGYLRLSFAASESDIVEGVRRIGTELGG